MASVLLHSDRGLTMVELMTTLALLGIVMSVASVSMRRTEAPAVSSAYALLRDSALRGGEAIYGMVHDSLVRFDPDGSVWGHVPRSMNRLTGKDRRGQ